MVANLSILNSPGRIDDLAENTLGLEKVDIDTVRIEVETVKEGLDD